MIKSTEKLRPNIVVARAIVVVLICAVVTSTASPAGALHDFDHWGHGYKPKPSADCSRGFNGSIGLCQATADAEQTWVNNGFRNGFVVPNRWFGCSFWSGYIVVCMYHNQTQVRTACGSTSTTLIACSTRIKTSPNPLMPHIDRVVVRLCQSCYSPEWHDRYGLEGGDRAITRHEYGHSIGLSENVQQGSVMNPNGSGALPNAHDREALGSLYNGHNDG